MELKEDKMLDYKEYNTENIIDTKDMKKDLKENMKEELIKSRAIKKKYMTIEEFKVTLKMLDIKYACWENSFKNTYKKYILEISCFEFLKRYDMLEFLEDLAKKNNLSTKIIYNCNDYNDLCIYFD